MVSFIKAFETSLIYFDLEQFETGTTQHFKMGEAFPAFADCPFGKRFQRMMGIESFQIGQNSFKALLIPDDSAVKLRQSLFFGKIRISYFPMYFPQEKPQTILYICHDMKSEIIKSLSPLFIGNRQSFIQKTETIITDRFLVTTPFHMFAKGVLEITYALYENFVQNFWNLIRNFEPSITKGEFFTMSAS